MGGNLTHRAAGRPGQAPWISRMWPGRKVNRWRGGLGRKSGWERGRELGKGHGLSGRAGLKAGGAA